jgi:hypothetical protein
LVRICSQDICVVDRRFAGLGAFIIKSGTGAKS